MTENLALGLTLVVLGGTCQGSFMLPMKYTEKWRWENAWLIFSSTAYLILPWLVAFVTVPQLRNILVHTSSATILQTLLFGLGWGLGALTFGLGVDRLGLALGFAIILGFTAAIGTLVPLWVLSSEPLTSSQSRFVLLGVALILIGVSLCSWAGKLKEDALKGATRSVSSSEPRSFAIGLIFCILSGVLSPFGNLGFAFGSEISRVALEFGTSEFYAANPLWAVITLPLFLCNASFCAYLLIRDKSAGRFLSSPRYYYLLCASMGALWIAGMALYGSGANQLGPLGSSIGWAILMSSIVLVANIWGVLTGEWKESGRKPLRVMGLGALVLIVAIFVIGLGKP
jgi:L-rhamnose-H+ transport protein